MAREFWWICSAERQVSTSCPWRLIALLYQESLEAVNRGEGGWTEPFFNSYTRHRRYRFQLHGKPHNSPHSRTILHIGRINRVLTCARGKQHWCSLRCGREPVAVLVYVEPPLPHSHPPTLAHNSGSYPEQSFDRQPAEQSPFSYSTGRRPRLLA